MKIPALAIGALMAFVLLIAPPAHAAPPANDSRQNAMTLTLPARVSGTVREATTDELEIFSRCGSENATVYYRFTATVDATVIAQIAAAGELDAAVAVFEVARSAQTRELDCEATDKDGKAAATFAAKKDSTYFVRVSRQRASVPGDFTLEVFERTAPAVGPGRRLPAGGLTGFVDRIFNPDDAYSVGMQAGTPYRIVLAAPETCVAYEVYLPGTTTFEEANRVGVRGCGNTFVFTPSADQGSGRYVIRVFPGTRCLARLRYHLQVAPAGRDDLSPGVFLRNYQVVRGAIDSYHVDSLDLYRFDVTRRSDLSLTVTPESKVTGFVSVQLTDDRGRPIVFERENVKPINVQVRRGRYFVAIKALEPARMRYRLRRVSRTITRSRASFNGKGYLRTEPGTATSVRIRVGPKANGFANVTFFRFDPINQWRYYRRVRVRVVDGLAEVPFAAPAVGRYSALVDFLGSREFSPSQSNYTTLRVAEPLLQ